MFGHRIHCHLKDRAVGLENDEAALQRMFRIELGRYVSATKAFTLMEKISQVEKHNLLNWIELYVTALRPR